MWHQFNPPNQVVHISRSPFGSYTKTIITAHEFTIDTKKHTKIEHVFSMHLPFFLLPFKSLISKYIDYWSSLLWEEDLAMCLRRQKAFDRGFKDKALDTLPRSKEGIL